MNPGQGAPQQQGGQQDALDKGVSFLSGKLGHQTDNNVSKQRPREALALLLDR